MRTHFVRHFLDKVQHRLDRLESAIKVGSDERKMRCLSTAYAQPTSLIESSMPTALHQPKTMPQHAKEDEWSIIAQRSHCLTLLHEHDAYHRM